MKTKLLSLLACVLLAAMLLVGCSTGSESSYSFETLKWGSTPAEAISALALSEADAQVITGSSNPNLKDRKDVTSYLFTDYDWNGISVQLGLAFDADGLCRVQLTGSQADADAMASQLTTLYGESDSRVSASTMVWGDDNCGVSILGSTAEWWKL
jgi:uncharacterized protein YcfL